MNLDQNQQIILIASLTIGMVLGAVIAINYNFNLDEEPENQLFEDETIYEVNESNRFQTIDFANHSTGISIDDGEIYLDLTGDGNFETQIENITRDGEEHAFVRNAVHEDKAYQLYYRYRIAAEDQEDYLQLYRIREI